MFLLHAARSLRQFVNNVEIINVSTFVVSQIRECVQIDKTRASKIKNKEHFQQSPFF
jgi:hypothetical protein